MQMYAGGSVFYAEEHSRNGHPSRDGKLVWTFHASSRRLAVTTETCWATNLPERAPTTFQRRGGCTTITATNDSATICKRRTWFRYRSRCHQTRFDDKSIGQFFTVGSERRRREEKRNERETLSFSRARFSNESFAFFILLGNRGFVSIITWNSRD